MFLKMLMSDRLRVVESFDGEVITEVSVSAPVSFAGLQVRGFLLSEDRRACIEVSSEGAQ